MKALAAVQNTPGWCYAPENIHFVVWLHTSSDAAQGSKGTVSHSEEQID